MRTKLGDLCVALALHQGTNVIPVALSDLTGDELIIDNIPLLPVVSIMWHRIASIKLPQTPCHIQTFNDHRTICLSPLRGWADEGGIPYVNNGGLEA